jgi:uncharacterized membrane protein (DUF2068 family)
MLAVVRRERERGLQIIVAYKFGKAALWFVFAIVLLAGMQLGIEDKLYGVAHALRHHAHAWSLRLADLVVRAASRRGLWTIMVALVADGSMSLVEGWALIHGAWWGPWVVVVATGALLPFEVVALLRHPHIMRALLFLVNLVIVAYLLRAALRERKKER